MNQSSDARWRSLVEADSLDAKDVMDFYKGWAKEVSTDEVKYFFFFRIP